MVPYFLLLFNLARATDGYSLAAGANQDITEFSTCKTVTNNKSKSIFIPTKFNSEWTSFYTNVPTGVTAVDCPTVNGYFVLSSSASNGVLGGRTGASTTCYNDLVANDWKGKASAGTLTQSRVSAFLCTGTSASSCNGTLLPAMNYKFAVSGDTAKGGALFTANSGGFGPGDSSGWNGATYFGAAETYWTGHAAGASTLWANGVASQCSSFNSTTGTGVVGTSTGTDSTRWNNGTLSCASTAKLLCMVAPFDTTPAMSGGLNVFNGNPSGTSSPSGSTGDLMVAVVGSWSAPFTQVTAAPAGWTRVIKAGSGQAMDVWMKVKTASEPGSYTWTTDGTNGIFIYTFSYAVPSQIGTATIVDSASQVNAASTTVTGASVTTTQPYTRVAWLAIGSNTITMPAGYTSGGGGNFGSLYYSMASGYAPTAGPTGNINGSVATSSTSVVITLAFPRP